MVDLVTNQKLLWKQGPLGDDGRIFESKPLDQSDEPQLVQQVKEARMALIEQAHNSFVYSNTDCMNTIKDVPGFILML